MFQRPNPDALLAGPLGQWLNAQASQRSQTKAKVSQRQTLAIIAACAVAFSMILFSDIEIWGALQAGFMVGSIGLGWAWLARASVERGIKHGINGAIADSMGLTYRSSTGPGSGFRRATVFEMLPTYDDDHFEDEWTGTIGDASFTLHEAKLTRERGSDNEKRTETVFEGVVMSLGFAREFQGVTLIERNSKHRGFLGGRRETVSLNGHQLQRVTMVDPRFEDRFAVWGEDAVEARYLVHPDYVDRLIQLENAFAGKNLRALFCGGELTVVLESGNMFESGSLDAGDDRKLVELTIEQLTALADLAQQLSERPRTAFN